MNVHWSLLLLGAVVGTLLGWLIVQCIPVDTTVVFFGVPR